LAKQAVELYAAGGILSLHPKSLFVAGQPDSFTISQVSK
jgi:hypothetical protein